MHIISCKKVLGLWFGKNQSPSLSWQFNVVNATQMKRLGAAFAFVLRQKAANDNFVPNPRMRIGLQGSVDVGKSTFVAGVLDTMPDKVSIDDRSSNVRKPRSQNVWQCQDNNFIRHYDARLRRFPAYDFPAYNKKNYGPGAFVVDLIENPKYDRDPAFHCLISIKRDESLPGSIADYERLPRLVSVNTSEAFAHAAGFQEFLKMATQLQRAEPPDQGGQIAATPGRIMI